MAIEKVSGETRLWVPSDRGRSSAFAVGMLRAIEKQNRHAVHKVRELVAQLHAERATVSTLQKSSAAADANAERARALQEKLDDGSHTADTQVYSYGPT